jgi:hypothetical protein
MSVLGFFRSAPERGEYKRFDSKIKLNLFEWSGIGPDGKEKTASDVEDLGRSSALRQMRSTLGGLGSGVSISLGNTIFE